MSEKYIKGEKQFYRNIAKLKGKEGRAALQSGFNKTAQIILVDSQKRLSNNNSRVTGKLMRSGRVVEIKGTKVGVYISYNANYSYFVENGRRRGQKPPIKDIYQWVRKKGLNDTFSISTRRKTSSKSRAKQQLSTAYAIQKSIGRKGTKARPYLEPAFNEGRKQLYNNLKASFEAYIKTLKVQ